MVEKIECKYQLREWSWIDTEGSGTITSGEKTKVTDLRGYWNLSGIRCLCYDNKEDPLPLFWCKNTIKCKRKEPPEEVKKKMKSHHKEQYDCYTFIAAFSKD